MQSAITQIKAKQTVSTASQSPRCTVPAMKHLKAQPLPNSSNCRTFSFMKPHSGPSLVRPAFPSTSKMKETRQGEMA